MTERTTNLILTAVDFDPFAGPELVQVISSTEPQTEIWLACQLGGDDANRSFNESVSLRFRGTLSRVAFEQAFRALVQRHEGLRSAFSADGRQICIFGEVPVDFTFVDASGEKPDDQTKRLADYVRGDIDHAFDLQNGPLVKGGLIRLSETDHHFTFTAHHIVCDGWSLGILLQDLGQLYSAYARQSTPNLPPPERFSTYATEQLSFSQSAEYQKIEQFWLNQYADSIPVLNLPTDAPRPVLRSYAGDRADYALDDRLVKAVRQMGIKAGCSFVTTLMASFEVLLSRLSGQQDIVLGLPAAGQSATGHLRLIGHCVNLLPLRSRPVGTLPFRDFLKQRKTGLLDALEHQRLTFGSLLKKMRVPRDTSRIPLVPVVFNVDMGLDNDVHFEGLTYQFISNPRSASTFELSLNATGSDQHLVLEWAYNTNLFRPETIRRFHKQFEKLLQTVVENPDIQLQDIDLNIAETTGLAAVSQSATAVSYPREKSLHTLISETASQFPDKVALRFGNDTLTYRALDERANQLAHCLIETGVRPGEFVGLAVDRSLDLIVSLLAILKTGAAYVPVDPQHPAERIEFMLADASCRVLVTSETYHNRTKLPVREVNLADAKPMLARFPTTPPTIPSSGQDLAYVLYTSGTTGRPKGALIRHHSVVNVLLHVQQTQHLTPADVTLTMATIAFDLSTVEIYTALITGMELVVVDTATARDGQAVAQLLQDRRVTFLQTTPATWRLLLETGWSGNKNLKAIACAEALPADLSRKLLALCRSLWNYYGPTETTIYATGKHITDPDEPINIGQPIANTQVYFIDEQLRQLPDGEAGELCIAGDGLANGYLNQPELTAQKFVQNPFAQQTNERLYRTGDLGKRLPNGDIQYLGRVDQQVKIRGHRIEVAEVEHQLLAQPGVKNAVVMAREDTPGDQRLVAYVVPGYPIVDSDAQIRVWREGIKRMLPDYMLPSHIVLLSELPVTANGKIDRKALPRPNQQPERAALPTEPQTDEEQLVASVWQDVLGMKTINIDANFFELGGHSLIAVQVMNRLEKHTGRRLPLSSLFEYPTIRKLAELIQPEKPVMTWKSLVAIKPQGSKAPLYVIHGIGLNLLNFSSLIKNLDAEQPIYGLQARGLDGTEEPLDSMEAIAHCYIQEVLEQNPDGPYAIAGYSFGGYVAYEMAQQLTAMGKEIKMLAMFDTDAQALAAQHTKGARLIWRIGRQFPKLLWVLRSFIKHPKETIDYQKNYFIWRFKDFGEKLGLYKEELPEGELAHMDRIMAKHEAAFNNYALRPYNGTLDLFRAMTRLYFVDDYTHLGWREFALKGVRVHDVPGDHETIMNPPNDVALAKALQKALDNR
ncbi:non-ribosomal peptide synthetase [Spirosoma montaniterrae]|uniref:Non-ribosomal peptide synthetase n=1 Tax=Spirosoma montaniterrae TaxID=1178516 RepID=A0A1P9WZI1_9BACT|nr:non-ribosomal peptide synthetase [Spirosoma montaniterrae]AQG80773.1 non-ribosomal peptide synthetase [Spirosoma montaniterrae]